MTIPRTTLITGAAKRIGRSIALTLAWDGWDVAIHYGGSTAAAEDLAGEIRSLGRRAVTIQADLGIEAETTGIVAQAVAALGPLGVLVNNASTFEYDSALDATRAHWDHHMEANLRAPLVLIQDFARQLPADAEGVVINLIDQRVLNLTPHFVTYTVSKAGLWTLTQTLAMGLAPRIRVNAIGPGPTLPSVHQTEAQFRAQCESMPLRRGTSPEEIAETCRYLIGARSVTGQLIALDGGQHLGWAQPVREDAEE